MRYGLKYYQTKAVQEVLNNLRDAKDDVERRNRKIAFALSATTGAGKTVMAAAVIEALFRGSDEYEFAADPTAAVLWVTDDPSLNEQTRHRFIDAADQLAISQLVIIDDGFQQPTFTPGHVYFLNVQKLRNDTSFVRTSNQRQITLWDTIQQTIASPEITLYMVLDEAHKGMRSGNTRSSEEKNRSTVVQRLINGFNGVSPVPIVWGISATVDRFKVAMDAAHEEGRITYPPVVVIAKDVQDSGLLKETMVLDFPDEAGVFDTTFLREAVKDVRQATELWSAYGKREQLPDPVIPLLVLQVPNTPSEAELGRYLEVIRTDWPELDDGAIAHVFSDHSPVTIGNRTIPWIAPQMVQESPHIRVLLAKDAVSTGWDCPRAEVLCSFRHAQDRTHITQLLGRMVRTPLARRVESDERLNAVSCFLPFFNETTATDVANVLTGVTTDSSDPDARSSLGTGRKVLTHPVEMTWNAQVPEDVRAFLMSLPSESAPSAVSKPITRLLSLATQLAKDKLVADPNERAHRTLYDVLNGQMAQHAYQVDQGVEAIHTAEIRRITTRIADGEHETVVRQEQADQRTVDDAFRVATRALGVAVANGYLKHLAQREQNEFDTFDAKARIAALLGINGVKARVEDEAETLARDWLSHHRVAIRQLREERRTEYDTLTYQDREPQPIDIVLPSTRIENTRDNNNQPLPTQPKHVLSDDKGQFPVESLNDWERGVVQTEVSRLNCVGWYRNPSKATSDALQVPWQDGSRWRSMQPDFIFINRLGDGQLAASIVDPHRDNLDESLPKLKGLARYVERYDDRFSRIESVAKVDGELRLLDLQLVQVREAIANASSAADLYRDMAISTRLE